jgi:hypothetical protein
LIGREADSTAFGFAEVVREITEPVTSFQPQRAALRRQPVGDRTAGAGDGSSKSTVGISSVVTPVLPRVT